MREARDAAETLKPILPPPVIEDDGTEFSRAFLRRGVPLAAAEGSGNERDPAKRLQARLARQALGRCCNKRKIEAFLSAAETRDPDLVEFWGVASSHPDQEDPDGDDEAAVQAAEKARQQICGADLGGGVWDLFFPEESRESNHDGDHSSLAAVGLTDGSPLRGDIDIQLD